jgi:L-2-hydroxyglutarate oxidase LhgO
MEKFDITVIGAGVAGLAIAARLARPGRKLAVLEKNLSFGQETSSRNSEVAHAGIYYPSGTLKAKLCVRGNHLLYRYLQHKGIRHKQLGKLLVATTAEETKALEKLYLNGLANGAAELELLSSTQVKELEPDLDVFAAIFSPRTGILDTHGLMAHLAKDAEQNGALCAYGSEVVALDSQENGFAVTVKREALHFQTRVVINAAGHAATKIAALTGMGVNNAGYRLHYCKGQYFRVRRPIGVRHLIYPVPPLSGHSLGIHITPDLAGEIRLGPDAHYVDAIDYSVDENARGQFFASVQRFIPGLREDDLSPDTAGVRPKLQGPADGFRDFVIRHEAEQGLPGLINLIGIESPGLTSCLAIAEYVEELLQHDRLI